MLMASTRLFFSKEIPPLEVSKDLASPSPGNFILPLKGGESCLLNHSLNMLMVSMDPGLHGNRPLSDCKQSLAGNR
jgi:hypothetical protein